MKGRSTAKGCSQIRDIAAINADAFPIAFGEKYLECFEKINGKIFN
jgi:hypothetical protein